MHGIRLITTKFRTVKTKSNEQDYALKTFSMIGDKFKVIREAKNLTLRDVEKETGISNAYLSQLENNKIKSPSYSVIKQLCDFYGIKTDMGDMDELTMLVSTMTDIEIANLTLFAKFILNSRKEKKPIK